MPGLVVNGTAAINGITKALSNGLANGHTNGHSNGHSSSHVNGNTPSRFSVRVSYGAALITFSEGHRQNPFSNSKMKELELLIKKLNDDSSVGCIVLYGGEGRSFGCGGDFNETTSFTGGDEVDEWIDNVTSLYTTIAGIPKPVVAAIDGFAIGLGLQIALCCDYRIGADTCKLMMPEFKMGIACNFGGFMLEALVGRSVMQKLLFTADRLNAQVSLKDGLLHEVVPAQDLETRALEQAQAIASWSATAVQGTRPHINASFVEGLRTLGKQAKRSHREAFAAGDAQANMKQIISKNQQHVPSWILITNTSVPSLESTLQATKNSGIHIYGQGAALASENFTWLDDSDDHRYFAEWTTSIEAKRKIVRMRTGALNDPPLYIVRNSTSRQWALGTDVFSLNIARSQWGMPVGFANPININLDESTSFLGVSQLPAHSYFEFKQGGTGWTLTTQQEDDPVLAVFNPKIHDFHQAGLTFVTSLKEAVSEMTKGDKSIATLLSGGIDSGAVTTFAHLSGLKVTAYSAGSPWGNEHEEAAELAKHLGIPHVRVDFSAEELLAAIPESMRSLGTAEQERVDIAMTITAMLRSGIIKENHVLTGYGSDLINLGIPPESSETEALLQEIVAGIDITRHSGEFTDWVARSYGKRISHPYWHKDVLQTAINIHPACKIQNGREKAFFRKAMEPYVPMRTAWRQKIGIHLGGGLQGGLDSIFGGRQGKIDAYLESFKAISERLLVDHSADILDLTPSATQLNPKDGTIAKINSPFSVMRGLTPSGAGVVIKATSKQSPDPRLIAEKIREEIAAGRWAVVRNIDLSEDDFKAIVNAIGDPVPNHFKTGTSDLMKLPADRKQGTGVLGRGPLPAHCDGFFVGNSPDFILLYSHEFSDTPGSGETFFIDQVSAVEQMPSDLLTTLESVEFEYLIQEEGHFPVENKWFAVKPIDERAGGQKFLRVAMHFAPYPGFPESWLLRVKGWEKEQSDDLLNRLHEYIHQEKFFYQHRWSVGELVVINNKCALHGRTAVSEGGKRCLFRGQVTKK